jgi:raffinose/stachyose/melibiose transport system substrate-binding protein
MAKDANSVSYTDSLQRFYTGQAAMYFSGSFDIGKFSDNLKDKLGVFPIPPPDGYDPYVSFHIDTAIGLNANSAHKEEAIKFLNWLTEKRFGELVGAYLPGFYPLGMENKGNINIITIENEAVQQVAKEFLEFNSLPKMGLDVRWDLPIAKAPDGRTLMQEGLFDVITNYDDPLAPQRAADNLQNGLAQWDAMAQACTWMPTPTPTITLTPAPTITLTPTIDLPGTPDLPFAVSATPTP